jgi:hypothetical protein
MLLLSCVELGVFLFFKTFYSFQYRLIDGFDDVLTYLLLSKFHLATRVSLCREE